MNKGVLHLDTTIWERAGSVTFPSEWYQHVKDGACIFFEPVVFNSVAFEFCLSTGCRTSTRYEGGSRRASQQKESNIAISKESWFVLKFYKWFDLENNRTRLQHSDLRSVKEALSFELDLSLKQQKDKIMNLIQVRI